MGLMAPSHERGFQKSSRALALSACSRERVLFIGTQFSILYTSRLFISTRRVESGTVALCFCGM